METALLGCGRVGSPDQRMSAELVTNRLRHNASVSEVRASSRLSRSTSTACFCAAATTRARATRVLAKSTLARATHFKALPSRNDGRTAVGSQAFVTAAPTSHDKDSSKPSDCHSLSRPVVSSARQTYAETYVAIRSPMMSVGLSTRGGHTRGGLLHHGASSSSIFDRTWMEILAGAAVRAWLHGT